MYSLENGQYSAAEVEKMLKSNRTVSYMFELLDKDNRALGNVTATGTVDFNSTAAVKRAASLSILEHKDIDAANDRVRPYMILHTPGGDLRFPLGVFLLSSPKRESKSGMISRAVDCYDLSQILRDDRFTTRYKVPSGTNYGAAISQIISDAGILNYRVSGTNLTTSTDIEFEIGTARLDAVNKLAAAINYNDLYVDARGTFIVAPYVQPEERNIEFTYATDRNSIVKSGASEQMDLFSVPNKIVRYLENAEREIISATAINEDPRSRVSTVSRGRTIVDVAAVSDIADQATLDAYVVRLLAERRAYEEVIFETAVMPMHEFSDCIYVDNRDLDISGKYIETAWSLQMFTGGVMRHVAKKAVY